MSTTAFSKSLVMSIAFIFCAACCLAQAPTSPTPTSPGVIRFGDHDIGTEATQTWAVTNSGDGPINLTLRIVATNLGDSPEDFKWSSSCLNNLPPKQSCAITVLFHPAAIGKDKGEGEYRKATLTVTNGKSENILLEGRAFQNLSVSPATLAFENQVGNTSSETRTVQLTNYTNATVNGITVTANGDFVESHAGCAPPISPGGSCAISVSFSPKQAGEVNGSLMITANLSTIGNLPRVISLHGEGRNRCKLPKFSWTDGASWLVLIISGLYFLGLVLVRWHMIAKPVRAQLVAEIEAVRAGIVAETAGLPNSPEVNERLARIHCLLDVGLYPFKHKNFPINAQEEGRRKPAVVPVPAWYPWPTRFFNAVFWTRGTELSGWSLAHEAELLSVALLPLERVRARLETAEQQLRGLQTPGALALADRVRDSLASGEALLGERARLLLQQFQSLVRPLSVPEAARLVQRTDLQQRLLISLAQFADWSAKNNTPAATLDDCQSRMQQFLATSAIYQGLATETAQQLTLPDIPTASKNLLQAIASFLRQLTTAIQVVQAQSANQAKTLDDCNKALSSLAALGPDATKLVDRLKNAALPDSAKTLQSFVELCRRQDTLVASMTQATIPSPGVTLLSDVLGALRSQIDSIKQIVQVSAAGSVPDLANCRELVLLLAAVPPLPSDLLSRIDSTLQEEVPAPLARWRALLGEALSLIFENTDTGFFQVVNWHNKMMWLVLCALLFIVALAITLGNAVLLLVGAVGGLLSRLTRTAAAEDVGNDYGATWGSLFLSPLTGALSAWGGILLIIFGLKLNVLGSALNLDWCNPYEPVALAIALLFGFLERLFDSVTGQLQDKLLKAPATPASGGTVPPSGNTVPTPTPAAPAAPAVAARAPAAVTPAQALSGSAPSAPRIDSLSPPNATVGKEAHITVHGANFQPGVTAVVTESSGETVKPTVEFKDAGTVILTYSPKGTSAFDATLVIANPDKLTATGKFSVGAA